MRKSFLAWIIILIAGIACEPSRLFAQGSVTLTPNIQLQVPAYNQSNWQVPLNYDLNRLDLLLSSNMALPNLSITGNVTAQKFCITSSICIAAFTGNSTTVPMAGNLTGSVGSPICLDSNLNITNVGCTPSSASFPLTSPTSNPAQSGQLRLANSTDKIAWRNSGNSADVSVYLDSSNIFELGAPVRAALQDECGARCDVASFGADITGTNSSTTAFQSAEAALPSTGNGGSKKGVMHVPLGVFKLSGTVTISPETTVECSPGAIILVAGSVGIDQNLYDYSVSSGISVASLLGFATAGGVKNCEFRKSGSSTGVAAIKSGDWNGFTYLNNIFSGFNASGDYDILFVNQAYFSEHNIITGRFESETNGIGYQLSCVSGQSGCTGSFMYQWIEMQHLGTSYSGASNGISLTGGAWMDKSRVTIHANLASNSAYNQNIVYTDSTSTFNGISLDLSYEDNGNYGANANWLYTSNPNAYTWTEVGTINSVGAPRNSYPAGLNILSSNQSPPLNLVADPGFRYGTSYWSPATGWNLGTNGPQGMNYYYIIGTGSGSSVSYLTETQSVPKSSVLCYSMYLDTTQVTSGSIIVGLYDTNQSGTNYAYGAYGPGIKGTVGSGCFQASSSGQLFWLVSPNGATIANTQNLVAAMPMLTMNQLAPFADEPVPTAGTFNGALPSQGAETVLMNNTTGSATPTAVAKSNALIDPGAQVFNASDPAYGASPSNTAAQNAAAFGRVLTAALAAHGIIEFTQPGTYNYAGTGSPDSPLWISSSANLVCTPGVALNYTGTGYPLEIASRSLSSSSVDWNLYDIGDGCTFTGASSAADGIRINKYTANTHIHGLYLKNFGSASIFEVDYLDEVWDGEFDHNLVYNTDGIAHNLMNVGGPLALADGDNLLYIHDNDMGCSTGSTVNLCGKGIIVSGGGAVQVGPNNVLYGWEPEWDTYQAGEFYQNQVAPSTSDTATGLLRYGNPGAGSTLVYTKVHNNTFVLNSVTMNALAPANASTLLTDSAVFENLVVPNGYSTAIVAENNLASQTGNSMWGNLGWAATVGAPSGSNIAPWSSAPLGAAGYTITANADCNITVTSGNIENYNIGSCDVIRVTSASGAFAFGGFTGGAWGRHLKIENATSYAASLNPGDSDSSSGNRITCFGACPSSPITNPASSLGSSFDLFYDATSPGNWVFQGQFPSPSSSGPTLNNGQTWTSSNITMSVASTWFGGPSASVTAAGTYKVDGTVVLTTGGSYGAGRVFECELADASSITNTSWWVVPSDSNVTTPITNSLSLTGIFTETGPATFAISCMSSIAGDLIGAAQGTTITYVQIK